MARRKRLETWLALILVAVVLIPAAVLGMFVFMYVTAPNLHPDPQGIRSATNSDPSRKWSEAVKSGREVVRTALTEQNLTGLSVAVGVDDEIVWAEGFGWADIDSQAPIRPDTQFRIGTASIALTSAAIGVLLEQKRMKLDAEIQTYVPEFPKKEWPVTVRQLMAHLSGLRNDGGDESPLYAAGCERPVDALRFFAESTLRFEPGTQYRYSNYGWILLSAAIEAAATEPFVSFMRGEVFDPLGMDDTEPDSATEPPPDRATPYFPRFAADPRYGLHLMRPIDLSCYAGAGVFLSTPSDLVRFGIAMQSRGIAGAQSKLLKPATVQLLQTAQRLPSGEETGYGLGWDLETVTLNGEQVQVVGHDGDVLGGPAASLLIFRERGIVVAVTSNISYAGTNALALSIAQAFAQQASTASH